MIQIHIKKIKINDFLQIKKIVLHYDSVSELLFPFFWSNLLPFVLIVYMKNVRASFSLTDIVLKWLNNAYEKKSWLIYLFIKTYLLFKLKLNVKISS